MWKHGGFQHWYCLNELTDYKNSPGSGSRIQNTEIPGVSSKHRVNGPSSNWWWKFYSLSNTGPYGCQNGIECVSITLSLCTITRSIMWMALCQLRVRRGLNAKILILCHSVCTSEVAQMLCWSQSNDQYGSNFITHPSSLLDVVII